MVIGRWAHPARPGCSGRGHGRASRQWQVAKRLGLGALAHGAVSGYSRDSRQAGGGGQGIGGSSRSGVQKTTETQRGLRPQPNVGSAPVADVERRRICAECEEIDGLQYRGAEELARRNLRVRGSRFSRQPSGVSLQPSVLSSERWALPTLRNCLV